MPISLSGEREEIQKHIEFVSEQDYAAKRKERILDSQHISNRKVIFLLGREQNELDNLLVEIFRCRAIYEQHRNKATDKEVEEYLRSQDQRASSLTADVERLLKKSLTGGSFIFRGKPKPVNQMSEDLSEAAKKYLDEVAQQVFEKYSEAPLQADSGLAERFLKTEKLDKIASKDDPLSLVKKSAGGIGIDDSMKAIVSLRDYLEQRGQVEGRRLLDDFYAAPYGWSKDTTRYLTAAILVGGIIKLRVSGEDITVRGDVALASLKNTVSFNKIGIALREAPPIPDILLRARERLLELTGDDFLPLEEEISKAVVRHFPDFQQDYVPLAAELRNLDLPGVERVESIRDNISEILKGDASDASNRLGGEECPLYDDLLWVRDLKKAFDEGIGTVAKDARVLLNDIPLLPQAGIPGDLITETTEPREHLSELLSREDFFNHVPDIQNHIHAIEEGINKKATVLMDGQGTSLEKEKARIQGSASWQQLGPEDQARLATELEKLQIGKADNLASFKKLINDKYTLDTELQRIESEIQEIIKQQRKGRSVLEKDLTHLPQVILAEDQIEAIITELETLKEDLEDYEEIILRWK
jgi:hypothetical protein